MRKINKYLSLFSISVTSIVGLGTCLSFATNNKNINAFDENKYMDVPIKILNQALHKDSINIILFGEGYENDEQEKFLKVAKDTVEHFFSFDQYKQLKHYINIYALNTVSNHSMQGKNMDSKPNDTYFETYKYGYSRSPEISSYGNSKINKLKEQITNNFLLNKNRIISHIFINSNEHTGISYGNLSFSAGNTWFWKNLFVHEMSHNFNLSDEYGITGPRSGVPNRSFDRNKLPWDDFLGFRNTGIQVKIQTNKKSFLIPTIYPDTCLMESTKIGSKFCEVCKYYSFKNITKDIKENPPMYVSIPYISESFDNSNDYNIHMTEVTNKNISLFNDKKIDMRFLADNPTDKNLKIKLKLEYINKTNSSKNQTKEQTFTIEPNSKNNQKPKQVKITFDNNLSYNQGDEATIVGYVYNDDSNKIIASTEAKHENQITINFLDAKTNENIALFNEPQTYYFDNINDIENFQPINLRGYKFNKKEKVKDKNNEWNWYYDKKLEKKIILELIEKASNKIIETKQWNLFEDEEFIPKNSDFIIPKEFSDWNIKFDDQIRIKYSDLDNNKVNKITYWLGNSDLPEKEKDYNDYLKIINDEIEKLNLCPITINDLGKMTNINLVNEKNIQEYVDNWPQQYLKNNVKLSIENFKIDASLGKVYFNLKFELNNISKIKQIIVGEFLTKEVSIKPSIVDSKIKNQTNNETKSTLSPWKITLIVISSLLGICLIISLIWIFVKTKRK